jgi:hypothetical protein
MVTAEEVIDRSDVPIDATDFQFVSFLKIPSLMGTLIGGRVEAITFGNRIFIQPESFDAVVSGSRPDLVLHELVHVAQWRVGGGSFLPSYLGQYLRFRFLGAGHQAAYRSISYEIEAYAATVTS